MTDCGASGSCEALEGMSAQLADMKLATGGEGAPGEVPSSGEWICAICLEKIKLAETAQIKGCEHAYCANCILTWASYKKEPPWCPQCRLPFTSLFVCKTLDGRMSDYMVEESVCLLLRCKWFKPVPVPVQHEPDEMDDYSYRYQDDEDEFYEEYYTSNVRLGNRRWGDTGYVRGGRKEARPVSVRQVSAGEGSGSGNGSGSGTKGKGKEAVKANVGRRAKRAQKRVEAELKLKQSADSVNS